MRTDSNTILITGGASGIGAALAHRLHDRGNYVIVAGRRQEVLDKAVAGRERMAALTLDVGDPQAITAFAAQIVAEHPKLNVLVNNAGIMKFEDAAAKRDLANVEATVVTNLLGPIRLIDALIDHLSSQPDAAIINVTSGLAFVPMIAAPTYSATKAAMHSYTISLREQLKGKVEVIELAPPGVQTGLTPGQANRRGYMPLDAFADEVMGVLAQQPTPAEIPIERAKMLRSAEREGRFVDTLKTMNEMAAQARAGGD